MDSITKVVVEQFAQQGQIVFDWYERIRTLRVNELVSNKEKAKSVAVFCADMINGFCVSGALASPRIGAISGRVANLFSKLHNAGVRRFNLIQEWHSEDAREFSSFGPHGIRDTAEAETILELLKLSFSDKFNVFRKNSLTPAWSLTDNDLDGIHTAIICGNCTDLCVREAAMFLRLRANEFGKNLRVVVVENCVQTFDLPKDVAESIGAKPHPGDMMHILALYEMSRNGIEVVKAVV